MYWMTILRWCPLVKDEIDIGRCSECKYTKEGTFGMICKLKDGVDPCLYSVFGIEKLVTSEVAGLLRERQSMNKGCDSELIEKRRR